jgi:hypothetical protein
MPICAYVGSRPTMRVAPPMIDTVSKNAYLRPMTSPIRPKTSAPKGRTAKPAPYTAKPESNDVVGLSEGKKSGARNGVRSAYR